RLESRSLAELASMFTDHHEDKITFKDYPPAPIKSQPQQIKQQAALQNSRVMWVTQCQGGQCRRVAIQVSD
ncbi:hypothetical protein, partial [Escherichia coli]|uniref:hypothetical protein n=1 Tax=Escherichia coli TaxID=562 RepID=UPI003CFE891F